MKAIAALVVLALSCSFGFGQASPYNIMLFKSQTFTATGQTGATIALNGLTTGSTVASSYTMGSITVTGVSLTTVTFSVYGSANNGVTFFPLALNALNTPGTTTTTVTATGAGVWQVNLAGMTHVYIVTSGTFTASSVVIQLGASPNGVIARNGNGNPGTVVSIGDLPPLFTVDNRSGAAQPVLTPAPALSWFGNAAGSTGPPSYNTGPVPNASQWAGVTPSGTPATSEACVGSTSTACNWRPLTADDIQPGFTINSFAGGSTVEIGATVSNPAFTASYSATPASAQITNTAGINSPLALTTPFTTGTVTGGFTSSTQGNITFTLSATNVNSITKTSTQQISFLPRVFSGVGASGASSSVTASGTTAILSNSAVLTSGGLSASQVGATFGPLTPSVQKIYLLLIGNSHTFKDAVTGFAFVFNTPTLVSFVNVNGDTVSMYLYESTNTLSGTFSVQVVS